MGFRSNDFTQRGSVVVLASEFQGLSGCAWRASMKAGVRGGDTTCLRHWLRFNKIFFVFGIRILETVLSIASKREAWFRNNNLFVHGVRGIIL